MSAPERLARLLGHQFGDTRLLEQALTHRSAGRQHNERLEFLGDAVLSFVISGELFRRFPEADEGDLSRLRARLVRGESLAAVARELELGDSLHLGSGELKSGGFRRESILADALEAILGAVYLDGGIEAAKRLILALFDSRLDNVSPIEELKDPKTRLQEFLQAQRQPLPVYEVIDIQGDAHEQTFHVTCRVEQLAQPVRGTGSSRRRAEQKAAAEVLKRLEN